MTTLKDDFKKAWRKDEDVIQRIRSIYGNEILSTRIGMSFSLAISLFFIVTNLWNGLHNEAVWSFLLVGYYVLVDMINWRLLWNFRKKYGLKKERKIIRQTGYLMIGLDVWFLMMLATMIVHDARESYNWITIVTNSLYMIYRIMVSVINMARCKQLNNPTLIAVKHIGMITTLISAIVLQASLIAWLGGNSAQIRVANGITGVLIFLMILVMSGFLIKNHRSNDSSKG